MAPGHVSSREADGTPGRRLARTVERIAPPAERSAITSIDTVSESELLQRPAKPYRVSLGTFLPIMSLRHTHLITLISLFVLPALSTAQIEGEPPLKDPEPVIEVKQESNADQAIESRIENIFSKIDGITEVEVLVNAGVVTLSGDVSNEKLARDAQDIAIRTAGVVTVEDEINRTLDVRGNVTPLLNRAQEWIRIVFRAIPLMILAGLLLFVFVLTGGWLSRRSSFWKRIAPNPFLAELISQAVRIVVIGIGAMVAMNLLGGSRYVNAVLGGAGVIGIAIGFAVRDSMENYVSSIMLSVRQPFRAKDHVIIDDREGIVARLTSRATILMTLDGNHLRIPNSIVFKGIILNYTTNPDRRFDFELGVDASDNPLAAMKVGMEALRSHDFVLDEPAPSSFITTVGDSNIVVRFQGWVNQKDTDFSKARSRAITSVKAILETQGFTLPEPIYRLRFDQQPAASLGSELSERSSAAVKKAIGSPVSATPIPRAGDADLDFDVSPDKHIAEKINKERSQGRFQEQETDLLDEGRPHE